MDNFKREAFIKAYLRKTNEKIHRHSLLPVVSAHHS
jgi:hypothetical protein